MEWVAVELWIQKVELVAVGEMKLEGNGVDLVGEVRLEWSTTGCCRARSQNGVELAALRVSVGWYPESLWLLNEEG